MSNILSLGILILITFLIKKSLIALVRITNSIKIVSMLKLN